MFFAFFRGGAREGKFVTFSYFFGTFHVGGPWTCEGQVESQYQGPENNMESRFFGPGFFWCRGFQLRLKASDCAPELAFPSWSLGHLLGFAVQSSPTRREREISPKFFRREFLFMDIRAGCPCQNACFFPRFGGPDRSFWPDVRRDIRPRTSSLG